MAEVRSSYGDVADQDKLPLEKVREITAQSLILHGLKQHLGLHLFEPFIPTCGKRNKGPASIIDGNDDVLFY